MVPKPVVLAVPVSVKLDGQEISDRCVGYTIDGVIEGIYRVTLTLNATEFEVEGDGISIKLSGKEQASS